MRDFNSRGLSLELRLLLLLLLLLAPLCQPSVGKTTATSATDDLPHPWLTENRTAKILELLCRPPATIKWDKIYGLKLRFSGLAARDVTLASVTTATGIPRRAEVPDIARVGFNGNWNSPSLSVLMPFTSKDFGEYSCSGQYKEQGSTGGTAFPYFNTTFTVNGSLSQSHNEHHFEVRVIDAHEVRVTWSPPKESKLIQASVSSTLVDKYGKDITAGRSLVTTNGSKTFVYTSGVLLEEFRKPNGDVGKFSMRLYVDSDMCVPHCRYSCDVPYTACFGQDVQFCVCSGGQEGQKGQGTDFKTGFYIVLALLLLLLILVTILVIVIAVFFNMVKTQKYKNCECLIKCLSNKSVASLAKYFRQLEQKRLNGVKNENKPLQKKGQTSRPDGNAPEQNPTQARSTRTDEPQSLPSNSFKFPTASSGDNPSSDVKHFSEDQHGEKEAGSGTHSNPQQSGTENDNKAAGSTWE